jgi:hypothetical protein
VALKNQEENTDKKEIRQKRQQEKKEIENS